jgi:two-component system, OmpR family, sensor kinase
MRDRLATRVTLVSLTVALIAVLIAGIVSLGLVRGAAEEQARSTLARQADLVATAYDRGSTREAALTALLRRQQVSVDVVGPGQPAPGYLTAADVSALESGQSVSGTRTRANGTDVLVEGRPVSDGRGVVLAQPASVAEDASTYSRRRLLVPLLLGLVGAGVVGLLLARRLARPLQDAATAAHRLAGGARDVRLAPEGPYEVAELADALNRLNAALATSEGREREFLLSVSHELRTPLTAVRGYAEALADGVVPPDDVARTGTVMLGEAERLDRLVGDLLDLARLRAQDFRVDLADVDLTRLVEDAGQVWRDRCAREGVELRVQTAGVPLVVRTDPTRVRQIVDGLAENALRVTPAGRPVVLAAGPDPGAPQWAWIEVRDGGPGLSDDDLAVAFERSALYERYRGVRRVGTGFGLALVQGLAQRLGGDAVAGRAPEGGARFSVRLPVSGPGQPQPVSPMVHASGGAARET